MILELGTGKTVWSGWIVWVEDFGDNQPLWWICLEHYRAFGEYSLARLLLKHKIILKSVPSSGTRVDPKWIEELYWEKAIGLWSVKKIFTGKTATEDLADKTTQNDSRFGVW